MAENWKQEGPLGDGNWSVELALLREGADDKFSRRAEIDARDLNTPAWVSGRDAQHLRDFARALERAADALEGKG